MPLRAEDVYAGPLLARALGVLARDAWPALLVSLLLVGGLAVGVSLLPPLAPLPAFGVGATYRGLVSLVGVLVSGHVTWLVLRRSASLAPRAILRVVATTLLVGLALVLGLALLVVPAIVIGCMLGLAAPIAVGEGQGPLEALRRSYFVTRGHKSVLFALGMAHLGLGALAHGLAVALFGQTLTAQLVAASLDGLIISWQAVALALLYLELSRRAVVP